MADVAALVFDIDSTQARTAATDLAKVQNAAAQLAGEVSKTDRVLRRANGQFASSAEVAEKYGSEIRNLAREFNPALNAVYSFQQAEERLNRAIALGVVPIAQKEAALERLRNEYGNASGAASRYTNEARNMGNAQSSVGNQFAQLNDVVVTAWGGMNPALIGMQQGMQMVQGFAGQTGPQALKTLGGAFMQLLNPVTLVTIGTVAAGAALIQWGAAAIGGADDAKTLEERIDAVSDSVARLNELNRYFRPDGINAMGEAYGIVTQEIRELIEAQRYLARESGLKELQTAINAIKDETGTGFFQSWFGDTSGGVTVPQAIIDAENRVQNLASALKITQNDAKSLGAAMETAFNAKNITDQISGLATVREYLTIIARAGGQGAEEARKMLVQIEQAEDAARRLSAAAGDLPGKFAAAASAASRIADELNRAVGAAARLAASAVSDVQFAQIELDFRTDRIGKAAALAAAKFDSEVGKAGMDQWLYNSLRDQAIAGAKETARILGEVERLNEADAEASKGGGGGGAALKAAEKGFQSLRELLEKESLFQVAEWQKRQAQLDQALAKQLITKQQYNELETQLQTYYFGTEFEKRQLQYDMSLEQLRLHLEQEMITRQQYAIMAGNLHSQQVSELGNQDANRYSNDLGNLAAHFGEMNQLAGGGYDSLLRAQRIFGAASALISTYTGAAEALKLPFPYNIAAAGKIIAAGMGFISAIKGGGAGGGGGGSTATPTAARTEPTRNILVRLEGPDYMVDMAESIMTQIYEQSRDGRVIISRDR